ncbi:efflux RND transporter periplasmic adaptor subunit [uncultured Gimesia sp.]|uniref:efflux RND transporter periplasmic adaptor subunit n=1 Tax=uncultured Gimesia sp. TaxID=1678688 RepID=UPI0030D8EE8C|tara:strand:+ start:7173 stop:9164 length:1992 start_codon:yes stop_codon:yes gene_type:complete
MNNSEKGKVRADEQSVSTDKAVRPSENPVTALQRKQEARRWWIKLFVQPALLIVCGAILIIGLGVAQRLGFISAGGGGGHDHGSVIGKAMQYICPMMCTPPQSEPGRCPVCAMELVPSTSGGNTDPRSIQIDPATRRVANIHTAAVKSMPMTQTIRAVGELNYDEGTLKTLSAYVDGRLDRLYADYTGVVVKKDDHLAFVYSPRLYSGQVELLLAKKAYENSRSATLTRVKQSSRNLYESSRQRLIELGMTAPQIDELERTGKANSRMHLCAPISGTVIEKFAVEGQYVKEGQAIYKLADLSTLWLMLELFPKDAATIQYGQKVEAVVQSLPGRKFTGRVAFIDPNVDPKTRTVGVRVIIPNQDGLLRTGDYAKATIDVPLTSSDGIKRGVYDPELANKWISPRHPHIVESAAGKCPICGVDLVPAAQLGFTSKAIANGEALVVPRDAVLMAGSNSVLYVETEPGRFEIRRVVLGPICGDQIVILSGVEKDEQVATRGNFLIDSQMQLAGNPSLIDPTKAEPKMNEALSAEMIAALSKLSTEERSIAENQRICPVTMMRLGSMGAPTKVDVDGKPIFICCEGCRESLLDDPKKYLNIIATSNAADDASESTPQMELPAIGVPEIIEPQGNLPSIETPQEVHERTAEPRYPAKTASGLRKETVK